MNRTTTIAATLLATLLLALTACERRELWLYERDLNRVVLNVDWSYFHLRPEHMTAVFYPKDGGRPIVVTTSDIYTSELHLPAGTYDVVLFNRMESEYSYQAFRYQQDFQQYEVFTLPLFSQPARNVDLYDPTRPIYNPPEFMAVDTLCNLVISRAQASDSLIRYKDKDQYAGGENTQVINMLPQEMVYTLRIKIFVHGLQYMYSVKGCIDGLADAYHLGICQRSAAGAQYQLSGWKATALTDSTGYITNSITTFGRLNKYPYNNSDVKLRLDFLLVDLKTTHPLEFNVANEITAAVLEADARRETGHVASGNPNELHYNAELNLDLTLDIDGPHAVLPPVENAGKKPSGFDAEVDGWEQVQIDIGI